MIGNIAKTWLKRIVKKISEVLNLKEFSWKGLMGCVIQETILTAVTVLVTVGTMSLLGAGAIAL